MTILYIILTCVSYERGAFQMNLQLKKKTLRKMTNEFCKIIIQMKSEEDEDNINFFVDTF